MARVLSEFDSFPTEKALVGEMLMAYGEIEFQLAKLIGPVLNQDSNTAARILFRVRGEGARIEVSDAILRPGLRQLGLEGQWSNTVGAVRHCKTIRNQYAHCHWFFDENNPLARLCFINLDQDAAQVDGDVTIVLQPVDLRLLKAQREYFTYAVDWLYYLDFEYRTRAGLSPSHNFAVPQSIPPPPLSNRRALLAHRPEGQTNE